MRALCLILATLAFVSVGMADPVPAELVERLTRAIRTHAPEATIELTPDGFTAKQGTMTYTVHSRSKTGEVDERTSQKEGPNFKGFLLKLSVEDGQYQGAAGVPQEFHEPYYPTYINAVPTEGGQKHYWYGFSYGSRIDTELKKAILAALPHEQYPRSFPILRSRVGYCEKCRDMMRDASMGTCQSCGQQKATSSANKLCPECSRKLGECQSCRAKLTMPTSQPANGTAIQ